MRKSIYLLTFLLNLSFQAFANSDSLLLVLKENSNSPELVEAYLQQGEEFLGTNAEMALHWIFKAENLSIKLNNIEGRYKSLKKKSEILLSLQEEDSAIVILNSILNQKLASSTLDSADIYNQLGVSHQSKGNIDKAFIALNKALELYNKESSMLGIIIVNINMGNCFYEAGKAEEALANFKEAYDLAIKLKDKEKFTVALMNYAMILLYVQQDTVKVSELLKELKYNTFVQNNPDVLSAFHQNLGVYFTQIEAWDKAQENYLLALEVIKNSDVQKDPGIYTGLGQVSKHNGNYQKALDYFNLAKLHYRNNYGLKLIYYELAQIHHTLNNQDSSQYYWQLTHNKMQLLANEKTEELVLKSKNNLEIIKKDNEINLLAAQKQTEELQNKIKLIIIITLTLLLGLLVSIGFLLFQKKKKQLELKDQELQLKKQKLTSLSLRINQKNQVLKEFESTVSNQEEEISPMVNDAKMALKNSLRIDEDWKEFELYFNDLNSGFYDKLKKSYPELTNNELKICSLSKLRFTLKEIAQTLYLSVDSVKSARYRIRKKLKMEKGQDLSDFLNKL